MVLLVGQAYRADLGSMDIQTFTYGLKKTVALPPAEAEARVRAELKEEGFGVLTEIDIKETFREKLDIDFKPYRILGTCNPTLAHQALTAEADIGLLLPCNLVVYQGESEGTSVVAVLDPVVQLSVTGRDDIEPLAREIASRLKRVLERI